MAAFNSRRGVPACRRRALRATIYFKVRSHHECRALEHMRLNGTANSDAITATPQDRATAHGAATGRGFMRPAATTFAGLLIVIALAACNNNTAGVGTYSSTTADCLPNLRLVDQYGQLVSLTSLKGRPVLFDFFYTSCPGPCLVLTARMRSIAEKLGSELGSRVSFVSVTVDPEHDNPSQLLAYAKEQRAEHKGWLFLTGAPAQVDTLMAQFKLRREHESDGSVAHVLEFFLVGADGHLLFQYLASEVPPARIAGDLEQAAGHNRLAANLEGGIRFSHARLRNAASRGERSARSAG
jgi:cytochrome oxidase Cu insertion factor (SCO1/SenC/PrrC family)